MTCATCRHAIAAPRYPDEYRHCALADSLRGMPLKALAVVRCAFTPPKWEKK